MYFLLNFLPLLLEVILITFNYINGENGEFNTLIFIIVLLWIFVFMPVYLLIVNFRYINAKRVSFLKSTIFMVLSVVLRVAIDLNNHMIKYGEMIGDVPILIYQLQVIVPMIIIIIGITIKYFICKRKQD